MNRTSIIPVLFLFVISFNAMAQGKPDLLNSSLTEPKRKIAYAGVKNIFTIQGALPGKQIRMERSGGPIEVKAGTSLRAIVRFDQPGRDTIRVFVDGKLVVEKPLEILELRTYKAIIRGAEGTSIEAAKLLSGGRLIPVMPGTWYKPSSRIESYRVTLFHSSRSEKSFLVDGAAIPAELDASALEGATRIRFDQIRMRKEDGGSIALDDVEYKISDNKTTTNPEKQP